MKFNLPDFNLTRYRKVYAGNRSRYATATAVSFIDGDTILAASFLNRKIYLIDISNGGFKIKNSIDTAHYPDLMDYKDGVVVVTNRVDGETIGGVSIFKLSGNMLVFKKHIMTPKITQSHGVRIVDEDNIIVTNTDDNNRGCFFLKLSDGTFNSFNNFEHYPKDVFIKDNRLLISSSSSRPSPSNGVTITNSILYLFDYPTLNKIDEVEFYGQTDCITVTGNDGFITLQGQDSILHFKVENDKLTINKTIEGFNFPHGVASFNNKVIVTNYGDNSLDILELEDLI